MQQKNNSKSRNDNQASAEILKYLKIKFFDIWNNKKKT